MTRDCLIIGFNDSNFADFVDMVRSMGVDSGAYRDLNLAFIEYEGQAHRSMDILNRFYFGEAPAERLFSNTDFLWPTILYLGTYLTRRGFTFDYVNQFHLEKDVLRDKLLHEDIRTIAITTTLYVSPHPILEIISFVRQHNERVKIVVGGPYIANQAKMLDRVRLEQQLRFMGADFYVISDEGELALVNLLAAMKAGGGYDDIENLAYKRGNNYVFTASSVERNPLDENMIDYSLFSRSSIGEFVSLRTAKSCPFSCSFCGFPQRAGKYTYLPVEMVEQELSTLADLGVATLTFLDDTFNVPKGRFKELLQMMIRNKYGFKWNSFFRSDHGDEQTIELMSRAGCEGVFLGIESGSDEMLERMNKTSRRRNYMQAIPWLRQYGISTHANFIIGFPGDTFETVKESISLIEEARPDFYRAQLWYCDPVTPIWHQRDKYGVRGSAFNWSHDTMDYETACDLVDRMFLCIQNSVWLPQNGFEQWSTFYLQRKGMSLDRLKLFLRFFNTAIREKLTHGSDKPISPEVIEGMRCSARFDQPADVEATPLEIYSGERYMAAESFWIREVGRNVPASALEAIRERQSVREGVRTIPCVIERSTAEQLRWVGDGDIPALTLAAFAILLSRLGAQPSVVVVSDLGGRNGGAFLPLRLSPSWDKSFADFAQEVMDRIGEATPHALHAFAILANPWRMGVQGAQSPIFETAYVFRNAVSDPAEDRLGRHPKLAQSVELLLEVTAVGEDLSARLSNAPDSFSGETMERLAEYYSAILREVAENPTLGLGEVQLDSRTAGLGAAIDADASEAFHF